MNQPFKSGQIFENRFELLGVLGAGGIGTVYKARQIEIERLVALKILHTDFAQDQELKTRFLREAKMLSELSHPNIVTIYHLGLASTGEPYLSMELINNGKSGRQLLNEIGRLPCLRALRIVRDAARALDYVHQNGIIHRDLKPENMLLTNEPEADSIKLIDFGLARLSENPNQKLTQTGELIGTVSYMSPEQCKGHKADARSDVYALAACLYEFVTGEKCFDADTAIGVMYKHLNAPAPTIIPSMVDRFTPSLNKLISRSLEKDPERRFQTMADFSQAIESAIDETERSVPSRKKTALILPCTCTLALIVIVISWSTYHFRANVKRAAHLSPVVKTEFLESPETVHIPSNSNELLKLSERYEKTLGLEAAITLLNRWLKLHARNASSNNDRNEVCVHLISAYTWAEQRDKAMRAFTNLLASNPGNLWISSATSTLVKNYADSVHAKKGIELCEEIRNTHPGLKSDEKILAAEATLYGIIGDYNRAIKMYKQMPCMASNNPDRDDNDNRLGLIGALCRTGRTSELPGLVNTCVVAVHNSFERNGSNLLTWSGSDQQTKIHSGVNGDTALKRSSNDELNAVAKIYLETAKNLHQCGQFGESLKYSAQAKSLLSQTSSKEIMLVCIEDMLFCTISLKDHKAISALQDELQQLLKQSKDLSEKATILRLLATSAESPDNYQLTHKYLQQSADCYDEIFRAAKGQLSSSQCNGCADTVVTLADILYAENELSETEVLLSKWIPRFQQMDSEHWVLLCGRKCTLLARQHRAKEELACTIEVLRLLLKHASHQTQYMLFDEQLATYYLNQAECLQVLSRTVEANEALSRAQKVLADGIMSDENRLRLTLKLCTLFDKLGEPEEADKYIPEAEELLAHLSKPHELGCLSSLAMLKTKRKDWKAAAKLYEECLEVIEHSHHKGPAAESYIRKQLAFIRQQ